MIYVFQEKASLNFNKSVKVAEVVTLLFKKQSGHYSSPYDSLELALDGKGIVVPITSLAPTHEYTDAAILITVNGALIFRQFEYWVILGLRLTCTV